MATSKSSNQKKASTAAPAVGTVGFNLPVPYRLFFLLVEPISALVGAYFAFFDQPKYLNLTHPASAPSSIPVGTSIVLSQLANLYFFFALNEAIVLRATSDLRVWKALLFCMLLADIGHLYTVRQLGDHIYWDIFNWNSIDFGNIPFVYFGATMRIFFLAGVGLGGQGKKAKKTA